MNNRFSRRNLMASIEAIDLSIPIMRQVMADAKAKASPFPRLCEECKPRDFVCGACLDYQLEFSKTEKARNFYSARDRYHNLLATRANLVKTYQGFAREIRNERLRKNSMEGLIRLSLREARKSWNREWPKPIGFRHQILSDDDRYLSIYVILGESETDMDFRHVIPVQNHIGEALKRNGVNLLANIGFRSRSEQDWVDGK